MKRHDSHAEFEELCALLHTGILSASEELKLGQHLEVCPECAKACAEYSILTSQAIPLLAARHANVEEARDWDQRSTRKALLARIRRVEQAGLHQIQPGSHYYRSRWNWLMANSWLRAGVAACIVVGVGFGAYRLGSWRHRTVNYVSVSSSAENFEDNQKALRELLASQSEKIARLESESVDRLAEIKRLHSALGSMQSWSSQLASGNVKSQTELHETAAQRDTLLAQLKEVQQAYEDTQKQLGDLKDERDKALVRVASLETRTQYLQDAEKERERRLREDEEYLVADRDIRELMGARNLYIADVFDVDSGSRTRKPFGRVFYTENKSLIFYAFDLDREPQVANATFQVWGEKDSPQDQKARPLNLGILYMDSASNRRWVLRFGDSKQLAEIDAVFVTVEPHGGSVKPTGKPFLYALLRKEANHP